MPMLAASAGAGHLATHPADREAFNAAALAEAIAVGYAGFAIDLEGPRSPNASISDGVPKWIEGFAGALADHNMSLFVFIHEVSDEFVSQRRVDCWLGACEWPIGHVSCLASDSCATCTYPCHKVVAFGLQPRRSPSLLPCPLASLQAPWWYCWEYYHENMRLTICLLYTSPSPRDRG